MRFVKIIVVLTIIVLAGGTFYYPLSPISLHKSVEVEVIETKRIEREFKSFQARFGHVQGRLEAVTPAVVTLFELPWLTRENTVDVDRAEMKHWSLVTEQLIEELSLVRIPKQTYVTDVIEQLTKTREALRHITDNLWHSKRSLHIFIHNLQNDYLMCMWLITTLYEIEYESTVT